MSEPDIERLWKLVEEIRKEIEQDQGQGTSSNKRVKGESGFIIKPEALSEVQYQLGYEFKDEGLLRGALNLVSEDRENNRFVLKMLGKSIIQTCFYYHYIKTNPKISRGELQISLNTFFDKGDYAKDVRNMGMDTYAQRSCSTSRGSKRKRKNIEIECLYAALVGAIAVDSGIEKATSIFLGLRKWMN